MPHREDNEAKARELGVDLPHVDDEGRLIREILDDEEEDDDYLAGDRLSTP